MTRELAADGRTILVSSHLMSEMAQTADHLVIIGRGRLLADVPTAELTSARQDVLLRSPRAAELAGLIKAKGGAVAPQDDGALVVTGLDAAVLAGHHQGVSLGHPGVAGAVLSAGLLLCVCTLLGLALGAVIRHTAGGIAATVAVILVPAILAVLPAPWNGRLGRFTLLEAARQVSALHPATNLLSPGWSLLVLLAWPAAVLAAAALLIARRDA